MEEKRVSLLHLWLEDQTLGLKHREVIKPVNYSVNQFYPINIQSSLPPKL